MFTGKWFSQSISGHIKNYYNRIWGQGIGDHIGLQTCWRHILPWTGWTNEEAAYKFLCWTEDNCEPAEKWAKIIEALTTLDKNNTIRELRLDERLSAAAKVNKKEQFGWSPDKPPSLPNLILVRRNLLLSLCFHYKEFFNRYEIKWNL